MKVFVYHTPELAPTNLIPDCAIAIDVLRATTTIATALAAGAEAVQVFSNLDQLMQTSEAWPPDKRLRAGERGGAKVAECDLGNSPLDCTPERVGNRRLFISTTNGTRCLERIQSAPTVLAGSLINRHAIVEYLIQHQPKIIWLVGSGWEGSFSLEDTLCAGAIVDGLQQQLQVSLGDLVGNDEAVSAQALFRQWEHDLVQSFHYASHGQRLLRLDVVEDLNYCARLDSLTVVPIQREKGVLVRQLT